MLHVVAGSKSLRTCCRARRAEGAADRGHALRDFERGQAAARVPGDRERGLVHGRPALRRAGGRRVEMLHAYSLVHDDLPAMDDDDLRRGKPSAHKAFDEATAILAGDAAAGPRFRSAGRAGHAFQP